MYEIKQSTAAFVPVRLVDSFGNPITSVAFGSVTLSVQKSDGSVSAVSVAAPDWLEATTGAFSGEGVYVVKLTAAASSLTGTLIYAVKVSGAQTYIGSIKVVANEEVDTYTNVAAMAPQLSRAIGLMHENSVLDQTVFDIQNNLTSGRLRLYNSKANAQAATGTGLVATYTITASYVGENVQTYTVVLEP